MNKRFIVPGIIALLIVASLGNFILNAVQTRGQLGQVATTEPVRQEEGVRALMARNTLFDALQGGAPMQTRLNAIAALERIAKGGKELPAFNELLQMLKDPDTESTEKKTHPVREAARDSVARVGADYPDALLDAAKNADANIRDQSREALKKIGAPMAEKMAKRLGDASLRAPLGDILAVIGPQTVPLITPYLQPPLLDPAAKPDDLNKAKIELIEMMGKFKVASAASAILPFENDAEPNVRRAVVTALSNIGDPTGATVLISALKNPESDPSARAAAAGALGGIATPAANEAMRAALSDYDLYVASAAAAGLQRAGDKAVPAITSALADSSPAVRAKAATASGGMTTPTLAVRALNDVDPTVRANAATALGEVLVRQQAANKDVPIPAAALAPLVTTLQGGEESVAANASIALARLGQAAVPSLLPLLASANDAVAYQASETLRAIGAPAVSSLIPLAQTGKPAARWAAVTLGQIGDVRATNALQSLSQSPDADTAQAATNALAKVKAG